MTRTEHALKPGDSVVLECAGDSARIAVSIESDSGTRVELALDPGMQCRVRCGTESLCIAIHDTNPQRPGLRLVHDRDKPDKA